MSEQFILAGCRSTSSEEPRIKVFEPATGTLIAEVEQPGRKDIDLALTAATRAYESGVWARTPATARGKVLLRAAALMRERAEELAVLDSRCVGMPIREARGTVAAAAESIEYFAGAANKFFGEVVPVSDNGLDFVLREPVGVCALIVPWNVPLLMAAWKVGPALACGNPIVLKPDHKTPLSALLLGEILVEAGLPEECISVLPGPASTGAALVADRRVAKVSFTGSSASGAKVLAAAAPNITRVSLELGGKSANLVFADADIDRFVDAFVGGIFWNSGQDCCARSRVIVDRRLHDELVSRLADRAERIRVGLPDDEATDMGPVISADQLARITGYIDAGQSAGATVVTGGKAPTDPALADGHYICPTVLADVRNEMTVAQEEIFGPVASVIPFSSEDEALRIANDVDYGLSGSIWTNDVNRIMRVVRGFRTGNISVNSNHSVHLEAPFGGAKRSGLGREMGMHAMQLFTEVKNVFVAMG